MVVILKGAQEPQPGKHIPTIGECSTQVKTGESSTSSISLKDFSGRQISLEFEGCCDLIDQVLRGAHKVMPYTAGWQSFHVFWKGFSPPCIMSRLRPAKPAELKWLHLKVAFLLASAKSSVIGDAAGFCQGMLHPNQTLHTKVLTGFYCGNPPLSPGGSSGQSVVPVGPLQWTLTGHFPT